MKKTELIIATLSIIALGMNFFSIAFGGILTTLTFMSLSMIYFYFGFAFFNEINLRAIFAKDSYKDISLLRIIGAIGAGIALSLTIIGLLFTFNSWSGSSFSLGAGLVGLLIVTIIGLFRYSKNKSKYYTRIFKRVVIIGALGLIFFLTPKTTWVELKYRNHADYVKAYKEAVANPDKKALWDKVDEERKKIYTK
jgi:hypothetical protein